MFSGRSTFSVPASEDSTAGSSSIKGVSSGTTSSVAIAAVTTAAAAWSASSFIADKALSSSFETRAYI